MMTQLLLGLASFTAPGSHSEKLVEQMTADEMSLSAPIPSSPQSWGHFIYFIYLFINELLGLDLYKSGDSYFLVKNNIVYSL